ncbi:transglutaminase-like domain-containing protein [Microvirga sp. 17 mud 1-3]|uniref:transglutaminase-like domain-containing protein n=1 Tax=Microvirga sp. 17 mud 1-3 TaxID=2082949 RepID=UPI000D6C58E8|nr:transglutaminase-like domain-containing protein [Microvirga sp. 17 mud 1-3]AWM87588.1 hypothetical protein C4E04_13150 [Microvirga sp. 17 mud 1-3]
MPSLISLGKASAQGGPTVTPSSLAGVSYVGKPISISIDGFVGDYEYRALVRHETDPSWNFDAPWHESPNLEVTPDREGVLSINIQVRQTGSDTLSLNKWIGQTQVFSSVKAVTLLAQPLNRFKRASIPSDLSEIASRLDWRASVHSPSDFAAFVRSHMSRSGDLRTIVQSDDGIFALSAMQIVSGLWHYGNFDNLSVTGCVRNNENLPEPKSSIKFAEYLSAEIGCCEDYATVLSMALEIAGIQNRVVLLETHALNEVFIDDEWWTLDANIGVAYQAAWEQVVDGASEVNVYTFPHEGMRLGSRIYSAPLNNIRTSFVAQLAAGLMFKFDRYLPTDWISNYNNDGFFPSGTRKITAVE